MLKHTVQLIADQPVDNYWIRANPNVGNRGFAGGINSAILRYDGAPPVEPTTVQPPSVIPMVEADLTTFDSRPAVSL